MKTIILKSDPNKTLTAPVPDSWTVEEAIATLRQMGHTPTHIEDEAGNRKTVEEQAA